MGKLLPASPEKRSAPAWASNRTTWLHKWTRAHAVQSHSCYRELFQEFLLWFRPWLPLKSWKHKKTRWKLASTWQPSIASFSSWGPSFPSCESWAFAPSRTRTTSLANKGRQSNNGCGSWPQCRRSSHANVLAKWHRGQGYMRFAMAVWWYSCHPETCSTNMEHVSMEGLPWHRVYTMRCVKCCTVELKAMLGMRVNPSSRSHSLQCMPRSFTSTSGSPFWWIKYCTKCAWPK